MRAREQALPADIEFDREAWSLEEFVCPAPSALAPTDDQRGVGPDPGSGAEPQPLGTHSLSAFETLRTNIERHGRGWIRVVQFESGPIPTAD